jgi:hypothetical protein
MLDAMTSRRFGLLFLVLCTVPACSSARAATEGPVASAATPGTRTAPVTTSTVLPPSDVVTGLLQLQHDVLACFSTPLECDISTLADPGSPAARHLEELHAYYVDNGLLVRVMPELTYTVPEQVRRLSADRVEVMVCEVDGSWQMDGRGTATTTDDVIFDDRLVSRRARHTLVWRGGRWRRHDIVVLEEWMGENRCPHASVL